MSNIRDVAKMAGVSITTVSKVISNTPYVSAETRARVEEAISHLHYSPNLAARSLLRQQSFIAALFIPYVEGYMAIDPYLGELIRGIEQTLSEQEYSLLLNIAKSEGAQRKAASLIQSGYVDGVLTVDIMPSSGTLAEQLCEAGIPAVANGYPSERFKSVVHADDAQGARLMVEHLLRLGHRRIGVIGVRPGYVLSVDARLNAIRETLASAGYPLDESRYLAWGTLNPETGMRACAWLLQHPEPPTAIYALNDQMALGALQQARALGIAVPQALSIVGNDNVPLAGLSHPSLTTVEQPIYEMGKQMAKRLIDSIRHSQLRRKAGITVNGTLGSSVDVLPTRLVVRESSGPVPVTA
jgi:DNA-binding LacI/PurR family transcriptional regulator